MLSDLRQKVFQVPSSIILSVGLCWDFIGAEPVDLDLSAVCFTKEGQLLDVVFFNHLLPQNADEEALRTNRCVNPAHLPYMFISGDSYTGGEEENQMSIDAMVAHRRKGLFGHHASKRPAALIKENLFSRLYVEEELHDVQEAVDDLDMRGGDLYGENGRLFRYAAKRELCDEVLTFVMDKIPKDAGVIFISVTSYTRLDFGVMQRTRLLITNETTGQCVGSIDLHSTTWSATANLAAMLVRAPPGAEINAGGTAPQPRGEPPGCWDLRELNIRTFGCTFVDVLPLMQNVLGTPIDSRIDALQNLPDYSLEKNFSQRLREPLRDVRFGVGWDGGHDLDAFLLMLDETSSYVDHVYPKRGKLRSEVPNLVRHSGDALSGDGTAGDVEFIDLRTHLLPSNVHTILVGATYMQSYSVQTRHSKSIYTLPKVYMRLQNRTRLRPHSFEVDRWNVYRELGKDGDNGHHIDTRPGEASRVANHATKSVRTLLLGLLVRTSSAPHETTPVKPRCSTPGDRFEDTAPLFEYIPVHQPVPVDPRSSFAAIIPFLQCVSAFLASSGRLEGIVRQQQSQRGTLPMDAMTTAVVVQPHDSAGSRYHALNYTGGLVGWNHAISDVLGGRATSSLVYTNVWKSIQTTERLTQQFAVEVCFLKVLALESRMPDRFRCHAEAWVHGQGADPINTVYKSPFLGNPEHLSWDSTHHSATAVFIVHRYDRIRVLLYEHATLGYGDIDLLRMQELWSDESENAVEHDILLAGCSYHLSKAKLRLYVRRVNYEAAFLQLCKERKQAAMRRSAHHKSLRMCTDQRCNRDLSLCSVM